MRCFLSLSESIIIIIVIITIIVIYICILYAPVFAMVQSLCSENNNLFSTDDYIVIQRRRGRVVRAARLWCRKSP